jgi:hypothetical protein
VSPPPRPRSGQQGWCASEALEGFLRFAREHKEIYRIIDEAEFADPQSYRAHYEGTAQRIAARLDDGVAQGTLRAGDQEVRAWALMGMNVFLGLRFGVWDASRPVEDIAGVAADLLRDGLSAVARKSRHPGEGRSPAGFAPAYAPDDGRTCAAPSAVLPFAPALPDTVGRVAAAIVAPSGLAHEVGQLVAQRGDAKSFSMPAHSWNTDHITPNVPSWRTMP